MSTPDDDNSSISIVYADLPQRQVEADAIEEWYHSCLLLIKNRPGISPGITPDIIPDIIVVEQIHFLQGRGGIITPDIRQGIYDPGKLQNSDARLQTLITTDAEGISLLWNTAKEQAFYIGDLNLGFGLNYRDDPVALNCRTATISCIQAMGLNLDTSDVPSRAGLDARPIPVKQTLPNNFDRAGIDPFYSEDYPNGPDF